MNYNIVIAIGLILFVVYIHKKSHFTFKRRLESVLITISTILLFSELIVPMFHLTFDLKDNLVNGIYYILATALVSDIIYKKGG